MTRKRNVSSSHDDDDNDDYGDDDDDDDGGGKKQKSMRGPDEAELCAEMCGFYAGHNTLGRCSKCYASYVTEAEQTAEELASPTAEVLHSNAEQVMSTANGMVSPMGDVTHHSPPPPTTPSVCDGGTTDLDAAAAATAATTGGGCTTPDFATSTMSLVVNSSPTTATTAATTTTATIATTATTSATTSAMMDKGEEGKKAKKNRCLTCKKKLGLTGFACRCGGLFCPLHRYSDEHACPYDYQEQGQREIRKNNPLVTSEKIHKL